LKSARSPSFRTAAAPCSITSSARSKIDVGTLTPSWLAVFMLTTSRKREGRSTGKVAGRSPPGILATSTPPWKKQVDRHLKPLP
jgi:hypothetical protein